MKFVNHCLAAICILILQGCGSSRVVVLEPVKPVKNVVGIHLDAGSHTTKVDREYVDVFESVIREKLYKEYAFKDGRDLTIRYRFIQFDPGSRFTRYMLGGLGNAGEGSMTVEFIFFDEQNQEVGKIHTEGKIGSGFFGGSTDSAVESAAEALLRYIESNFVNKK